MITEQIKPRFNDLDPFQHVNNAIFTTYLEVGRVALFRKIRSELNNQGLTFILARLEIDYVSPIFFESKVEVKTWVSRIGTKSFDLNYHLYDYESGKTYAKGKSIQVRFDYSRQQSIPIDDELRMYLEKHLENINN